MNFRAVKNLTHHVLVLFFLGAGAAQFCCAGEAGGIPAVMMGDGSAKLNGHELCTAPGGYISLQSAKKILGSPAQSYARSGPIYSWHKLGIELHEGFRGPEKGRVFIFRVNFVDEYYAPDDFHPGSFPGHVLVDGLDFSGATSFNDIRGQLEKKGYVIDDGIGKYTDEKGAKTDGPATAAHGEIMIFFSSHAGKVTRIDLFI
jgi:hypothetical protein